MMEKNKGGRPSKYETSVKPRFAEIADWLNAGATDKEIAHNLGLNKSTFCEYKKQFIELNELVKNGRRKAVQAIKAAIFKRAIGFSYREEKIVRKKIIIKDEDENEIPATVIQTEECEKYSLPDPACAMILLKHWDKEGGWTNDPASLALKKEELEFRKKQAEEW